MKVAPLITVALVLCIAFPGLIQAKRKFCVGKDGNRYKEGEGYVDREGEACIYYKCVKKNKKKFVMKSMKCVEDGEWSPWSSWSDCSATCGIATKKRTRTCSNPAPSNGGKPCSGPETEIEKCSNPSCGPDTNEKVDSLELNVQSLNDSMQTLQTTMLSVLELMTTIQSTADKQGSCMSDLSSSSCPVSAPGKIGVVDGFNSNKADININKDGITSTKADINANKAEITSTKADINTNKADINTNKAGITSTKADINTNKAGINTNKAEIMSTKADINTNKAGINTNEADINTNEADINTNEVGINTNKAGINTNKAGINTNKAGINTNIEGINTNKADINTNKDDILSNKAAITGPVLLHTDADYNYYKIPVPASLQMLSTIIATTCSNFGMWPQCFDASYADNNCIEAPSTSIHGIHPRAMSKILCDTTRPQDCASTLNMFWYMKQPWHSGSACGATKAGSLCSLGKDYTSASDMQYFAACLKPVIIPVLIHTDDYYHYYKIPVPASLQMLSTVIATTCNNFGMQPHCYNADYADNNCIDALSTSISSQHPIAMSMILCDTNRPEICASTLNMFWYMDDYHSGSACGATYAGGTCSTGNLYTSTSEMQYFAACLKPVIPDWTIIQRRAQYGNAEDYFYKDFKDYENGFGSVDGELWLGLKKLSALTSDGEWELQVELMDWDDKKYRASYGTFSVGPAPTYTLQVGGFDDGESTLGDTMAHHNGQAFSARDKDQDASASSHCAVSYKGGWWYNSCGPGNLNGLNFAQQKDGSGGGMKWRFGKARGDSYKTWKESVMKIKRITV